MSHDAVWRMMFTAAIAVLMLGILLVRSEPVPFWVLIVYPVVGALLANIASRTSPTIEGIARLETSTVAAAAIFVLAALVNVLLIDVLLREFKSGEFSEGDRVEQLSFLVLPAISVLLWWALERRLTRMRRSKSAKKK